MHSPFPKQMSSICMEPNNISNFPQNILKFKKLEKIGIALHFSLSNSCQSLSHKNQHLLNSYKFQEKHRGKTKISGYATQCHSMPKLYNIATQIKLKLHFTFLEEKTLKQLNF